MTTFDEELSAQLHDARRQGLLRELRRIDSPVGPRIVVEGQALVNFASNDYLGLANHPVLKEAAVRAVERYGAGSGASRLVCGSLGIHHELEEALADYKGVAATHVFSTGYAAALGAIGALVAKDDVVILDKLAHACLVDGARLSGAKLRVFRHNDLDQLEHHLRWADARRRSGGQGAAASTGRLRILVVTESVFSMDGDGAPLRQMVALKERYGAWLLVDEAHATGVYGEHGRGLVDEYGLSDRVEVQMGTLGKALGASGGYLAGSRAFIDVLVNRARSLIFSTAPVPAAAGAARAAIQLSASDEGESRRRQLWRCRESIQRLLPKRLAPAGPWTSPIVPLILGDETRATGAAQRLREAGIYLPAIRYPAVARGAARLRLTLSASHSVAMTEQLGRALRDFEEPDAEGV